MKAFWQSALMLVAGVALGLIGITLGSRGVSVLGFGLFVIGAIIAMINLEDVL